MSQWHITKKIHILELKKFEILVCSEFICVVLTFVDQFLLSMWIFEILTLFVGEREREKEKKSNMNERVSFIFSLCIIFTHCWWKIQRKKGERPREKYQGRLISWHKKWARPPTDLKHPGARRMEKHDCWHLATRHSAWMQCLINNLFSLMFLCAVLLHSKPGIWWFSSFLIP